MLKKLKREDFPRLKKLWADNKYHNHGLNGWLSEHGWYVIEVVRRPAGSKDFKVISGVGWWKGPSPGWALPDPQPGI